MRAPKFHAGERVDLDDLHYGVKTFPNSIQNSHIVNVTTDKQGRFVRGFRVEIADQTTYPGRITVHGGYATDFDGQPLFNSNQLQISRTLTLEGSTGTFYVELQFAEADADVDARAFWDPTVDQGTDPSGDPKPDGQEFGDNVSTRLSQDWSIVTPVSTTGFDRDTNPDSIKVPLIYLETNASNEIDNVTTENPRTTILEVFSSATKLRVQNAQLFKTGTGSDITIGDGLGTTENRTVNAVDVSTGVLTLSSALFNSHYPGEIIRAYGTAALDVVIEETYGRYRRPAVGTAYDYRDKMFQGDEVHGDILARGHDAAALEDTSDVNPQSMKDYIDFLAGQIEELKWGSKSPYTSGVDDTRIPPGISSAFSTNPRYYEKSSGVNGSRTAFITVGDGVTSWGDFTAADETSLQKAIDSLPARGTIYVKAGAYVYANTVDIDNGYDTEIIFDKGASIAGNTGASNACFSVNQNNAACILKNLYIFGSTSVIGLILESNDPSRFEMHDCKFEDVGLDIADVTLPANDTHIIRCQFSAAVAKLTTRALVQTTNAASSIRGKFENCKFKHAGATGLSATLIDAAAGGATTGIQQVQFKSCYFDTLLGTNTSQIDLDNASTSVDFMNCEFNLSAGTAGACIKSTGGSGLRILDCRGFVSAASLLTATAVYNIIVDNYTNPAASSVEHMKFTNCERIQIINCNLTCIGSGSHLTEFAVEFISTGSYLSESILFVNNIINGNSTANGLLADVQGSGGFKSIEVTNSDFRKLEVGVYCNQSASSGGEFIDVNISDNTFIDTGTDRETASMQKVCILTDATSDKIHWSITNNDFKNLNPANATTFSTAKRAAIEIHNTLQFSTIVGNRMENIGDSSNPTSIACGIYTDALQYCTISNNVIEDVRGSTAYGMYLTASNATYCQYSTIADNVIKFIDALNAAGTVAAGIEAHNFLRTSITGNTFSGIQANTGSEPKCISVIDSGGVLESVNIANNVSYICTLFYAACKSAEKVNVTGNTMDRGNYCVFVTTTAAGTLDKLSIIGNIVHDHNTTGIHIVPDSSPRGTLVTVNNNSVMQAAATSGSNIYIANCTQVTVNSNIVETVVVASRNIRLFDVIRSTVTGNTCTVLDAAVVPNIQLSGTVADWFTISCNVCLGTSSGGLSPDANIDTSGAEPFATASGGVFTGNILDEVIKYRGDGTGTPLGTNPDLLGADNLTSR